MFVDWKFEAIEKLKEYAARKNAIMSIPEEIKRLEDSDGETGGGGRENLSPSRV